MKFPWNVLEPLLIPFVKAAVADGFSKLPETVKPFLSVAFCAYKTEIIEWADKTPTTLDNAAIVKLGEEVVEYLNSKDCYNLPGELDRLFT